jgi:hypothetical protein
MPAFVSLYRCWVLTIQHTPVNMHLLFLHNNIQIIDGENTSSVVSLGWTLRQRRAASDGCVVQQIERPYLGAGAFFVLMRNRERPRTRRLFIDKFRSRWRSKFSIQILFSVRNGERPGIPRLTRVGQSKSCLIIHPTDADASNINHTARKS